MNGPAALPYALDGAGHTARARADTEVAQMLEQILFVLPGERVNRPDFGSHLLSLTFSARTSELTMAVQALVEGALRKWTGDAIHVQDVRVAIEDMLVVVTVRYLEPLTGAVRQVRVSN